MPRSLPCPAIRSPEARIFSPASRTLSVIPLASVAPALPVPGFFACAISTSCRPESGPRPAATRETRAGTTLDHRRRHRHMAYLLIENETPPNPATLKLIHGSTVREAGTRDQIGRESGRESVGQ